MLNSRTKGNIRFGKEWFWISELGLKNHEDKINLEIRFGKYWIRIKPSGLRLVLAE
jgi:hypothetical protein